MENEHLTTAQWQAIAEKPEKRRDDRSLFNGRGFPSRPIWPEVYKGRYEK